MTRLVRYGDLLEAVERLGIIAFYGKFLDGFPRLQDMTSQEQWHTGDPETDPWVWKDRAAEEKRAAFGCLLGGYKGFVSRELYPFFYRACHPERPFAERYGEGEISRTVSDVYRLFQHGEVLSTSDIRRETGVRKGRGASAVDAAVRLLQKEFYISVCGSCKRLSLQGREYGWSVNTYILTEEWASEWLEALPDVTPGEARDIVMESLGKTGHRCDAERLRGLLFGSG